MNTKIKTVAQRTILSVAVALGALVAAGCAETGSNQASGQIPRYTEARAEQFSPPQIMLVGPDAYDLRENTLFEPPMLTRDSADLLKVVIPVRVTGDKRLHVQYRVTFFDKQGQPLPGASAWFRQSLTPGSREFIQTTSTTPRAEGLQVEIRYAM